VLWDDITTSIQNIDPENALMLSSSNNNGSGSSNSGNSSSNTGEPATSQLPQVKMEAIDESLLETFATPLLSPLEIKTEKQQQQQQYASQLVAGSGGYLNGSSSNSYGYSWHSSQVSDGI